MDMESFMKEFDRNLIQALDTLRDEYQAGQHGESPLAMDILSPLLETDPEMEEHAAALAKIFSLFHLAAGTAAWATHSGLPRKE